MGPRRPQAPAGLSRRTFLITAAATTALAAVPGRAGAEVPFLRYAPPPQPPLGRLTVAPATHGSLDAGSFRVILGPGSVRIHHGDRAVFASPDGAFLAAANGHQVWEENTGNFSSTPVITTLQLDQSVDSARLDGGRVRLTGTLAPPANTDALPDGVRSSLSIGPPSTRRFTVDIEPGPHGLRIAAHVPGADLTMLRAARTGGAVHGGGEQFAGFDLSGRRVPIVTREQGVGRGLEPLTALAEATQGGGGSPETTYAPLPFVTADDLTAIALDTDDVSAFDFRAPDRIDLTVWSPHCPAALYTAGSPVDLLAAHTADTGRMRTLPAWSGEGAVIGLQGGTGTVTAKLAALEQAGAAISAVWLQDWCGQRTTDFGERLWWNWVLDRDRYPGWEEFVARLRRRGIRVLTYVNVFLTDASGKPGGTRRNLFAEAAAHGYLVAHPNGGPYLLDQGGFDAALVDLTNPDARAWFSQVLVDEVAGAGADGWMADFGEGLPFDAVLHTGSPAQWHNRWPTAWAELNDEARVAAGKPGALVFHRSAGRGSAAHTPLFWAGDQLVTWDAHDGMASALLGMLAGGVSGMTLTHSDTGGYTGLSQPVVGVRRDRELLLRWTELSVWGPVLRTHEGNQPDRNAQAYDTDTAAAFAEQTRIFAALADYRARVVGEAAATGLPALRHAWIHYPGSRAAGRDDQFLFGDGILVAPTMEPGRTARTATLPPGDWVHVWSGHHHRGDSDVTVPAPLGRPAVFLRVGHAAAEEAGRRVLDSVT